MLFVLVCPTNWRTVGAAISGKQVLALLAPALTPVQIYEWYSLEQRANH